MFKGFDTKGRFTAIMGRVWDLIVLNILLLLCSVPIVTAGAAITAVYDMSLRMLREQEDYIIKGFFHAFRVSFRQATKLWLLCLAWFVLCVGDLFAGRFLAGYGVQPILSAVAGIQFVLLVGVTRYSFALTARFENTVGGTLKNSVLLMIANLPETILMMLVSLTAPLILCFVTLPDKIFPCFITLLLLVWFAGAIYLNAKLLRRVFQRCFQSEETPVDDVDEISSDDVASLEKITELGL